MTLRRSPPLAANRYVHRFVLFETAVANKQNFTPEKWTKVLESTMLAGIAVSQADPSGLWGTLKEYFANTSALDPSKLAPDSSELIKAVIADFETPKGRSDLQKALSKRFADVTEPAQYVQRSLSSLREVSAITRCQRTFRRSCLQSLATRHQSESGKGWCGGRLPRVWRR